MATKSDESRYEKGLKIRTEVLGEEYVKRATASMNEFSRPVQELVTEYCWGTLWARPGLPRKTRSLINIAMITALNHPPELKAHVKGALRNGCTRDEIMEVLMQTVIYCGVPAGVAALNVAKEALAEVDAGKA